MKRIREFRVALRYLDGRTTSQVINGWHKAWDIAEHALHEQCVEGQLFDARQRNSPVIAVFSHHNFQNELSDMASQAVKTRWRTDPLGAIGGTERFANTNLSDFGWSWVEGAQRDLPFRLNYLERSAERNPEGLMAFMLGLGAEARDLLRKI